MRGRTARALLLLVLLAASGCMRWSGTAMPAPGGEGERIGKARLTLVPAGTLLLRNVTVRGDSVTGHREGRRVALHRSRVSAIEAREFSPLHTLGAAVVALVVTYMVLMVYLFSTVEY